MLEPTEALASTENALRQIVKMQLGDAWEDSSTPGRLAQFAERRLEEGRRRDGVFAPLDLLAYTDFTDLTKVILNNWDKFEPVFDDQRRLRVYFALIEDFRNAIAHSRQLASFEQELLSGMATQIRNQISLHRLGDNPSTMHYPIIESTIDSLGHDGAEGYGARPGGGVARMNVGDTVEIRCRAIDPRGRELLWSLQVQGALYPEKSQIIMEDVRGPQVTLSYTFTEDDVCEGMHLNVRLRSAGRFHRNGADDDVHTFLYDVNPPLD